MALFIFMSNRPIHRIREMKRRQKKDDTAARRGPVSQKPVLPFARLEEAIGKLEKEKRMTREQAIKAIQANYTIK